MRINGNRDAIIQRMMVEKTGKPNNTNSKAKDAAYKASDSGGESAPAKRGDQTTGINYSQLAATGQSPRAESGGYNSAAQADKAQSGYAKGDIVNLSA